MQNFEKKTVRCKFGRSLHDNVVIDSIRSVDKNSEDYKILANSIQKDRPLYPITVRKLNADEQYIDCPLRHH